jgi:phosphatidylglycerol:prolipoprotein diacylglycerol transferase
VPLSVSAGIFVSALPTIQASRASLAYIVLNIDPVLIRLGPLAVHWYGLMYVLAISCGLWVVLRWSRTQGIQSDSVWRLFLWTALAGLVGGRLYFVIQQPDLLTHYLLAPWNILAVWNGGMAFFGAIMLGATTLFLLAPRYGIDRFLALDAGALFALVGQPIGRLGNIINGDITGYPLSAHPISVPAAVCIHAPCVAIVSDPHFLPWALVYLNAHSFAAVGIPYQPAPIYEMLGNLLAFAILWPLRFALPRRKTGYFFVAYIVLYALSQLLVFFFRGSEPITPLLGIDFLKQAQWTALVVLLACIPLAIAVRRFGHAWRRNSSPSGREWVAVDQSAAL